MKHNSAGRLMVMLTAMQVVRVASEECGWQHVQGCGFVAVELWTYPYPELFVLGEVCIWIHILQAFFPTEILKPTCSWIILCTSFWPGPPWQCSREIMVSPWSPHVSPSIPRGRDPLLFAVETQSNKRRIAILESLDKYEKACEWFKFSLESLLAYQRGGRFDSSVALIHQEGVTPSAEFLLRGRNGGEARSRRCVMDG